jgi:tetratricopeptide (TPR) repeat protein
MKRFLLLSLFITSSLYSQVAGPTPDGVQDLLASQQEFSNLPEEKRKEFADKYNEAARLMKQKRIFESLDMLREAEKIFDKSVRLHNLKGSCYVELRIFDKAEQSFNKALKLNPNNPGILFNIAECMFVGNRWQESHDKFQEVLKLVPNAGNGVTRLIEFKLLLCKKKLGLDQEAKLLAEKYDYQDDSPFYYYARAAQAFDNNDTAEAEQWLARARRIFRDPNLLSAWQDTIVEFGYVKSFLSSEEE